MIVPSEFLALAKASAAIAGTDPVLLCAIAKHETDFGMLGAGREGYTLGYGYPAPGQGDPRFKGIENQLRYASKQIAAYMGWRDPGKTSWNDLNSFAINSWKAGDPHWQDGVWSWYQAILKEVEVEVEVVLFFGPDDMVLAKRVAEKVGGMIAERSISLPINSKVYSVGGPDITGAVNLSGNAWEDTAEKVIKFLRG